MTAYASVMHRLLSGHDLALGDAEDCMEMLLVGMAARSDDAAERVSNFEDRIRQYGGYNV